MKTRVNLPEPQTSRRRASSSRTREPIPPAAAHAGFWARFIARLRSWFEVPLGYEDEAGFHYGVQSGPTPRQTPETTLVRAPVLTDRADQAIKHSVTLPVTDPPVPEATPAAPEKKAEPISH